MKFRTVNELYLHLDQFNIQSSKRVPDVNEFDKVSEDQIVALERELGFAIPSQLRRFYLEVGTGFLNVDEKGQYQNTHPNNIIDLERIRLFWKRQEVSFLYDQDLVAPNELVFFDMGDYSYLVMRPFSDNPNKVYFPFDEKSLANDFNDFIMRLYENTTFYLDPEGTLMP